MGALAQIFSYPNKILAAFYDKILPAMVKLVVLAICVSWKYYNLVSTNYKYMWSINDKSLKFTYKEKEKLGECAICLSEVEEGEEGLELVECKHSFHRCCLEKWLGMYKPTCPLCRSLVVPEAIVAEYQKMLIWKKDNWIEKEIALVLLNALDGRSCNGYF